MLYRPNPLFIPMVGQKRSDQILSGPVDDGGGGGGGGGKEEKY